MSYSLDDGNVLDTLDAELSTPVVDAPDLPFTGGWIGYLGYECAQLTMPITLRHHSPYPDAYFVRPQSFIVYDHQAETAHLCALAGDGDTGLLDRLEQALKGAEGAGGTSIGEGSWSNPDYLGSIERAQELLRAGESYEVCLTDTFTAEATGDIYPSLREHNPAPYAAHLIFDGVEVASASPCLLYTSPSPRD